MPHTVLLVSLLGLDCSHLLAFIYHIFCFCRMLVFLDLLLQAFCFNHGKHHRKVLFVGCSALQMSEKRHPDEGKARSEGSTSADKRRRVQHTFRSVVLEVMKMQSVKHFLEPILEPLIRRVVKEEVDLALKKHSSSMKWDSEEKHPSELRSLQLQFLNNLSLPVFTGARIEGEECSNIKVALVDALTGQIVKSGPESSAKVEIVVLEGDFDGDESENWTLEEFKNNIVREREGKKPLLTGDAVLNLKEGIGSIGEISFTDNSSWTRSRKFRLGARVVDNFDGTRVRETKTVSFIVRDHRGELYKKHHPPSLSDEVWRLEKIGKDGAFHKRLSRENINTVRDFLILLYRDPQGLRNILGTGMSTKMWEVTVEHARTCMLDKKLYLYPPSSQQKTGVIFNVVGQLMGLLSECQYVPIDRMSDTEKAHFSYHLGFALYFPLFIILVISDFLSRTLQADAHKLVISAIEHLGDVEYFEDEASLMGGFSNLSSAIYSSSSPKTESSNGSKFVVPHKIGGFDHAQPSSSPDIASSIYSFGGVSSLDDYALHNIDNMGLRYEQTLFPTEVANSLICDTESMTRAFCDEDHLQFFETDCSHASQNPSSESPADLHSAVNSFLLAHSAGKAQRRWRKIFSVLKWFSIKRIVDRKRIQDQENQRYSQGL